MYVPGWDCHGLPIENQIEKTHGRNLSRDEVQAKSRAYATEQIAQQMADFKRVGVLGDWDQPVPHDGLGNEADEIRALKRVIERGFVYRGLKPVYWCFDCGSSLAEFEIEYADKKIADGGRGLPRAPSPTSWPPPSACPTLSKDAFAVIWTTTAWTIPANQALNLNPELDYALVRHRARPAAAGQRAGRDVPGALRPDRHGAGHDARARSSPASTSTTRWPMCTRATTACRPVYLADYATADDGTGIVHSSPAYGVDDFNSCCAHGLTVDDILNPVQGHGSYAADLPLFGGLNIWKAVPLIVEALRDAGRLLATGP